MLTRKGNTLMMENHSTIDLAKAYGTPLYVYSEMALEKKLNEIKREFLDKYPNTHAAYACKAFCTVYMMKLLNQHGFWIDVVSAGELYTAVRAGFPMERVELNGNNKTNEELSMAIEYGVGRIIVDNVDEFYEVVALCEEKHKRVSILFRITPNVSADTHDYIATAKKDSKFGIPLEDKVLYPLIEDAINTPNINFLGIQFHVGSQLMTNEYHKAALEVALTIMKETRDRFGYTMTDINVGGGFGIQYTGKEEPMGFGAFMDPIMVNIREFCEMHHFKMPHISIEPGRFIVGEACIQLYTIGQIKVIPGVKTYASVDGGMTDNLRPGLYGAEYNAIVANKANEELSKKYAISGKCCESTDILIKELASPLLEKGDILAVLSTGAYGFSMASNYNRLPIPAVVVVNKEGVKVVVKRQTYEEMIANDVS